MNVTLFNVTLSFLTNEGHRNGPARMVRRERVEQFIATDAAAASLKAEAQTGCWARHMAINGGFHRVVITGEWDEVLLEIKTREFTPASCDPRSMALASLREHAKK